MFSCAACAEAERRGGDLREANSGTKGSCDGPREWKYFKDHPSGGFTWTGCPRRSIDVRVEAWVQAFDRCDGELSYTEQRRAPMLLLEVFEVLDYVRGLRAWDEAQRIKAMAHSAPRGKAT